MIDSLYQKFLKSKGVFTDTRKVIKGGIFFALKGPNFDANTLAQRALLAGASYAVVDDPNVVKGDAYVLTEDVLQTLQDLARHHRDQLTIPVVGLTGSNGKTTSKELIASALKAKYNVYATVGNLNNHIGVPLSVLSITNEHEIAVIEMGANHVGEIGFLCSISKPSHGLITNIGKAHLEGFGGIEGVIRGKSELYHHLIQHNGTVWINSNNSILSNMAKRFKNPLFYPNKDDFYFCELIDANPTISLKAENNDLVRTHLVGTYNFENIAAALCIAKFFEVIPSEANKAIAAFIPENNRSQIIKKGSNMIILDAYNANPSSMQKALENLNFMSGAKKIAILGDMNELGNDSSKEHVQLGNSTFKAGFDQVLFCGLKTKDSYNAHPESKYFADRAQLIDHLKSTSIEDSTILIKASRSIGLEKIVEYL